MVRRRGHVLDAHGRPVATEPAYRAAGGGRRWAGVPAAAGPADILGALPALRARARWYYRHHPLVAAGVDALVADLVGWGITPRSRHPDATVREEIDALWAAWAAQARIDTLLRVVVRETIVAGEVFIQLRPRWPEDQDPYGRRLVVPLECQVLPSEYVPESMHRALDAGGRIVAGIELDALDRRAAYWIYRTHPQDPLRPRQDPVRVPASAVLHLAETPELGQLRGVSRLARVLTRVRDLEEYVDATLARQSTASMFTAFVRRPRVSTEEPGIFGESLRQDSALAAEAPVLEPGAICYLEEGEDIEFARPPDIGDYDVFVRCIAQDIAAGLGVTYEQLTGDLSRVNYSSIRAGMIAHRRQCEAWIYTVLVPHLLEPLWVAWLRHATLARALEVPGLTTDPVEATRVEWMTPGWEWVDPLREAQAAELAIRAGLTTRRQELLARGLDPAVIERERADEVARARRDGVAYSTDDPVPGAEVAPAPEPDDERAAARIVPLRRGGGA